MTPGKWSLAFVVLLIALVAYFSFTSHPEIIPPSISVDQTHVTEQHLTLHDGRIVTCLTFSPQSVTCDWPVANSRS